MYFHVTAACFIFTHTYIFNWKCVGDALSPVLQRSLKTSNQTPSSLTPRSAVGLDGGHISSQREWKPSRPQLSRTEITRPAVQSCMHKMHDLLKLQFLTTALKGQPAAGLWLCIAHRHLYRSDTNISNLPQSKKISRGCLSLYSSTLQPVLEHYIHMCS